MLGYELSRRDLHFTRQQPLPVRYKGINLDCAYQMDVVVENLVVLELKSVEKLLPIHDAQLLTYLKLSGISLGLLLNFNVTAMKDGIRRIVNHYAE